MATTQSDTTVGSGDEKPKSNQDIPCSSIMFFLICFVFVFLHIRGQISIFKFFKILFIPILIFLILFYNYKQGKVFHYIVDTILVFISMLCIKVSEYLHPLFIPPIHEPIKDYLETYKKNNAKECKGILKSLYCYLKKYKIFYCLFESIKRCMYMHVPSIPDYCNPLYTVHILCSGILGLIILYAFWPTLANALGYITNSQREWLNVSYSEYSILTSIIFIGVLIFFVRVYIYFNSNYRFFDNKGKHYKSYSDIIVKLQEQAYTFRNINENIILVTIAFYFIFIYTRNIKLQSTSVETLFFQIALFAIFIALFILVGLKLLKLMFVKSGLARNVLQLLNAKDYLKLDLSKIKDTSKTIQFIPESHEQFSDKKLWDYIDDVAVYTLDNVAQLKIVNAENNNKPSVRIATLYCDIKRKYMNGFLVSSTKVCNIKIEENFQKENIDNMFYNLCNASSTYTEYIEKSAKCIPFVLKYASFHVLPIMLALICAYIFTKLHRMMYPRKKYSDNDMFVETFLIFICGFYPLMYILDSNDALSMPVKLIITFGFILFIIPTGIVYIKEKFGTLDN